MKVSLEMFDNSIIPLEELSAGTLAQVYRIDNDLEDSEDFDMQLKDILVYTKNKADLFNLTRHQALLAKVAAYRYIMVRILGSNEKVVLSNA